MRDVRKEKSEKYEETSQVDVNVVVCSDVIDKHRNRLCLCS